MRHWITAKENNLVDNARQLEKESLGAGEDTNLQALN